GAKASEAERHVGASDDLALLDQVFDLLGTSRKNIGRRIGLQLLLERRSGLEGHRDLVLGSLLESGGDLIDAGRRAHAGHDPKLGSLARPAATGERRQTHRSTQRESARPRFHGFPPSVRGPTLTNGRDRWDAAYSVLWPRASGLKAAPRTGHF